MTVDDILADVLRNEGGYVNDLSSAIAAALAIEGARYVAEGAHERDAREYQCAAPECHRRGYAAGYCNAHYIRARKGQALDAPIRNRKRSAICITCRRPTNAKGGWHRCTACYKAARQKLIKAVCIAYMGGECVSCRGVYPMPVFDFHHVGEKSDSPASLIASASPERIAAELSQCELLCANCHRMEHHCDD